MKYVVFTIALVLGVPAASFAAVSSARLRGWLLAALVFSAFLDKVASIHFMSMEHYRGPERGFEVTLTDLIAWALILALLIQFPGKLRWMPYNSAWMFLFFGVACASTWQASDRLLASFTLFKLAETYVVFWCVVNCLRVGTRREYVWMGMVAIGACMTLVALKQKYVDHIVRIPGPFDHSNTIPSFVNLIVPVLLVWGLCDRRLTRAQMLISLAAVFGMIFAVVATLSRAGILLSVGCMLCALAVANFRARSVRVTATSLVICAGLVAGGLKAADTIINRFRNAPEASEEAREEFNGAAEKMVRQYPLGVGPNNFSHVLTITPQYREHFVAMANEKQAGVAHHIYLLTAAELGVPGLVVFLIFIVRFAWLAGRYAWSGRSLEGMLLSGLFLGFCALYLVGLLEWTMRITPVNYLFAICTGTCVAFAEAVRQQLRMERIASLQQLPGDIDRRAGTDRIPITNTA